MGTANTVQNRFWHRQDDGSESAATFRGSINSGWTPTLSEMDVPLRLRFEMSNTGGKNENSGAYELYMDKGGAGYNKVTTTSTDGCQMVASAYVSDGTTTTEQMSGSQTHQDGEFDSNGTVSSVALASSRDMELEFCFKMVSANLGAGGQTLSFRVYLDGSSVDGYTNTPTLTVPTLPSATWTQAEFRIRPGGIDGDSQTLNANGAGDWAAAANTNATLQSHPTTAGCTPRIRFKVACSVASGTITPKIQYSKNGGAYADLPWDDHTDQLNLTAHRPIGCFNSYRFTDGDATTQVLSGSSFVAGSGEDSSNTAAGVALTVGDHTEFEFPIFINKLWNGGGAGHVHGDYYEFRLVESDGTVFDTYTNTPRITLDYDNKYIGGTYAESIGEYGVYEASDGDRFTIIEDSESGGNVKAIKMASGTTRWVVVDNANSPTGIQDMECLDVQQVGDTLHIFYAGGDVRYETFNMATDSWGQLDEQVGTGIGVNQVVAGARRSDGTIVCAWVNASDDLVYKIKSGTWGSENTLHTGTVNGAACRLAASDKIYFAWTDNLTTIYSRSLNSSDTLGTLRTISTDPRTSGTGTQWSVIKPVYWDDSGTEKVGIIYQVETDAKLYWRIISNDGAPATEAAVTSVAVLDNAYGINNRQPSASAQVNGTDIYVVYMLASDQDVYFVKSSNGGSFGTAEEILDGVTIQAVAMQFIDSELVLMTEEYHKDSSTQASGYTGGVMYYTHALSTPDSLTADGMYTTPVLDAPTISQVHALTATGMTITPVLDTPTLTQLHILTATGVTTTPVLDTPTATETHILTATGVTTTPVLDAPTISQVHALTATGMTTTPVLDAPTLSQVHILTATGITTTPVLDAPTLAETHILTASGITTTPVLDAPTISTAGVDGLTATGMYTTPVLDAPTISQVHALTATGMTITPVLDAPTVAETHPLTATGITITPVLDAPTIAETHVLTATGITTTPVLDTPTLSEQGVENLTATGITTTPVLDAPTLTQVHSLTATGITTTPVLDISTLSQEHVLNANNIAITPVVDRPTLTVIGDGWSQSGFRIRADGDDGDAQALNANSPTDWVDSENASSAMRPSARRHGTVFGLRFKVGSGIASEARTLKIQAAKNSGAYSDLSSHNHNDQLNLTAVAPIGVFPTNRFADGAATTQLLSGSSFVAGTGEHGGTAAPVTLDEGEHTELEWRVFINKTWDNCGNGHLHGDYYDFRLVESDGTPLDDYGEIPRITLDYDNNYVGGCYPESIGKYGIFYASDGDSFTFVEESEITGGILAMRRASGTDRWVVVDSSGAPANMTDLESFHLHQVGDVLHIFYVGNTARYETFDMSTHSWGGLDEQVDTSIGSNQVAMGVKRSDNTVIMAWVDGANDLVYKERSSGGVWDGSSTRIYQGTVNGASCVLAASDKIYFAWVHAETTIYSQSMNSSNTLGTLRTISTDPRNSGSGTQWAVIAPVYWDDSGDEKVGIIYQVERDLKLYWQIITNDGSPGIEVAVTDYGVADNPPWINSRQTSASALVDGTNIYVGYCREETDFDLYFTSSENGAGWATDTEVADGVTTHGVGLGLTSSTLVFITEEAHIDSGYSGFTGGIQVREHSLLIVYDLAATGITTTPALAIPTISQVHALTATGITVTPVLDAPTISQAHGLTATGIISAPVLDAPTLSTTGIDNLTAIGITTTPVLDTSTPSQLHVLSATGISVTPIIDAPTITVYCNLDATGISVTPVLGTSALGQIHALTANNVTVTPIIDAPNLGGNHALTATGILVGPILGISTVAIVLVGYPVDIEFSAIYPTADIDAVYPDIEISVITED